VYISTLLKHNAVIFRAEMSKGGKVAGSTEQEKEKERKCLVDARILRDMMATVWKQGDVCTLTSKQPTKKCG
jgi:hypothetical protein